MRSYFDQPASKKELSPELNENAFAAAMSKKLVMPEHLYFLGKLLGPQKAGAEKLKCNKKDEHAQLDSLPKELLLELMSYFTDADLGILLSACKFFTHHINKDMLLFRDTLAKTTAKNIESLRTLVSIIPNMDELEPRINILSIERNLLETRLNSIIPLDIRDSLFSRHSAPVNSHLSEEGGDLYQPGEKGFVMRR